MKTIIVGDIHGHISSVATALAMPYNVVFVGDYLDSFGQSVDDQIKCLIMVMDAIDAEPDRVVGLLGNHEMSYLEDSMICSGWKSETANHVVHLKERMLSTLKNYHWVGDYLITHAGVSNELLRDQEIQLDEYLEAGNFLDIGYFRGGTSRAGGGLYWNDFSMEMVPVPGYKQVVGHSNNNRHNIDKYTDGVRLLDEGGGQVWCVDNLNRKAEVLMIDGDEAYPHPLALGPVDE